jgi:small subunit ribosomal protein S1
MAKLLSATPIEFREGAIFTGRIVAIHERDVLVDIGYKSEGVIPKYHFDEPNEVKIGDQVQVYIEQLEDEDGTLIISKEKADQKQNWEKIVQFYEENIPVEGKVRSAVKGGLMVSIGCDAFLPASQIDVTTPRSLSSYIGETITVRIVKVNEERKNVVVSRRELIEEERARRRQELLTQIEPGAIVTGTVKNITDFGAFLDLEGLDGLIHITDLSWNRVSHPSELLKIGQKIDVVVLEIDKEKERVSLGLKQLTENPWEKIAERLPVGTRVRGKITSLLPYGAFVALENGMEGLIHVSELSWTKRIARPSDVLAVGQEVEAVVLSVNPAEQKISLGVRQLEPNPWDSVDEKFPVNSRVKGIVRNLTAYGAFVELEGGIDGMIHVSDLSWTRRINHPSEVLKKGQEIEAVVLEIDKPNQRISLGIKQLATDPWEDIDSRFKIGDIVTGKVSKLASFGAFVDIGEDIDGLVHISQISDERVEKVKDVLKVGDTVTARVIKVDKVDRRIGLSIKAANYDEARFKEELAALETIRPGEDLVTMGSVFDKLGEEYRPGQSKQQDTAAKK